MNVIMVAVLVGFLLVVALAVFLYFDDRNNVRIRAEEDRLKALQQEAEEQD